MKKRVVQFTFASGRTKYRVEVARAFLGITLFWVLDSKPDPLYPERVAPAVFGTLEEACVHCGFKPGDIVNRMVVAEIKYDEV